MIKNKFLTFGLTFLAFFCLVFSTKLNAQKSPKPSISSNATDQIESSEEQSESSTYSDPEASETARLGNYAVVQALNKTTAKTSILELKVGEKFIFGSIKIIPHKCWQSPPEQKPENKILLEIIESKHESNEKIIEKRIFYGWMFSSSPSISGLEHPIYDIIAINCKLK